jgi:hypothetical protein
MDRWPNTSHEHPSRGATTPPGRAAPCDQTKQPRIHKRLRKRRSATRSSKRISAIAPTSAPVVMPSALLPTKAPQPPIADALTRPRRHGWAGRGTSMPGQLTIPSVLPTHSEHLQGRRRREPPLARDHRHTRRADKAWKGSQPVDHSSGETCRSRNSGRLEAPPGSSASAPINSSTEAGASAALLERRRCRSQGRAGDKHTRSRGSRGLSCSPGRRK